MSSEQGCSGLSVLGLGEDSRRGRRTVRSRYVDEGDREAELERQDVLVRLAGDCEACGASGPLVIDGGVAVCDGCIAASMEIEFWSPGWGAS